MERVEYDVLAIHDEQQFREECVESVAIIALPNLYGTFNDIIDPLHIHYLIEHGIGSILEAFLEGGTVAFDHDIRSVFESLISFRHTNRSEGMSWSFIMLSA